MAGSASSDTSEASGLSLSVWDRVIIVKLVKLHWTCALLHGDSSHDHEVKAKPHFG